MGNFGPTSAIFIHYRPLWHCILLTKTNYCGCWAPTVGDTEKLENFMFDKDYLKIIFEVRKNIHDQVTWFKCHGVNFPTSCLRSTWKFRTSSIFQLDFPTTRESPTHFVQKMELTWKAWKVDVLIKRKFFPKWFFSKISWGWPYYRVNVKTRIDELWFGDD